MPSFPALDAFEALVGAIYLDAGYEACRAVCERRVGHVPSIYAVADVCRPDLLVEIEGVAFSRVRKPNSEA